MAIPVGFLAYEFQARNGTGSITVSDAKAGDLVIGLYANNHWYAPYPSGVFESIISTNGQVQQIDGSDHSSETFTMVVARKLV